MGFIVAREHAIGPKVLSAHKSLARSRGGLTLEQVIRAQLRGELREVVRLPEVRAST